MARITIEPDEKVRMSTCSRCGLDFPSVHGFLYRDEQAWAVYWAALFKDHAGHPDPRVELTIAIGDDWSETSDPALRAWVQIDVWTADDEIRMTILDPIGGLESASFGVALGRNAALSDPRRDYFFQAADEIVESDPRVANLLVKGDRPLTN